MDSIVEAKVKLYLTQHLHYQPHESGQVLNQMRSAARAAGYELDTRFGNSGMAVGPEGRCAANIVNSALVGSGGDPVSEREQRAKIDEWIRTSGPNA